MDMAVRTEDSKVLGDGLEGPIPLKMAGSYTNATKPCFSRGPATEPASRNVTLPLPSVRLRP